MTVIARTITDLDADHRFGKIITNWRDYFLAAYKDQTEIGTFFVAIPGRETEVAGAISEILDMRTGIGYAATQSSAGIKPTWSATGSPRGRPIVTFDGDQLALPSEARPDTAADFSMAILFKDAGGANKFILGSDNSGNRFNVQLQSTGVIALNVGANGGTEANAAAAYPAARWTLGVTAWEEAAETAKSEAIWALGNSYDEDVQAGAAYDNTKDVFWGSSASGGFDSIFALTANLDLLAGPNTRGDQLKRDLADFAADIAF